MRRTHAELVVWALLGLGVAASAHAGAQPWEDGPYILGLAHTLANELRAGDFASFFGHLASRTAPQPAGAYVLPVLGYALLPGSAAVPWLGSALALWAAWDGVRRATLAAGGRLEAAVVAWGLVATSALALQAREQLAVDLVAAACTTQAWSWMVASDSLRRRGPAVAAGAWLGAVFLAKYSGPPTLFLPCLWEAVGVLRGPDRRLRLEHAVDLVGAMLLVAAPFYLHNAHALAEYLGSNFQPLPSDIKPQLEETPLPVNLVYYPAVTVAAVGWPLAILLLAGLARAPAALALGAVGGAIGLSIPEAVHPEYWFPAFFMLSTAAVAGLWETGARLPLLGLGLVGAAGAHYDYATSAPAPYKELQPLEVLASWGRWPLATLPRMAESPPLAAWEGLALTIEALQPGDAEITVLFDERLTSTTLQANTIYWGAMHGRRWNLRMTRGEADRPPVGSPFAESDLPPAEILLDCRIDPRTRETRAWLAAARWTEIERTVSLGTPADIRVWSRKPGS